MLVGMDTPPQPYVLPQSADAGSGKRVFAIIAVAVLGIIALLAAFLFFAPITAPVQGIMSALSQPAELAGARFAPASFATARTAVYTDAGAHYATKSYDGHIVGFATGKTGGVVTQGSDGVYRIVSGDEVLVSSTMPVLGASISPNGKEVAFSRKISGKSDSRSANDFEIVVTFPATGREIVIGKGFAPLFTDNSHLTYFAPVGVHAIDLATGSTTLLVKHTFRSVVSSATYSPDYMLTAWSDLSETDTLVYRLATGEQVASYPQTLPLITLGNDQLYSLDAGWWGTTIDVHSFTGSSRFLHWLPKYYQIRKLAL